MRSLLIASLAALAVSFSAQAPSLGFAAPASSMGAPAPARTVDTVESLFGTQVSDPYRWMEGDTNSERASWLRTQGEYTTRYLARLPGRGALLSRLLQLGLGYGRPSGVQLAGGRVFHYQLSPGEQLPKLMVLDPDGKDRVLLDPKTRAGKGTHASVNSYSPSPDGSLVACVISEGGSEVCSIHVLDVATGREHPDRVGNIWGEFAPSWLPDGKGYFYTQMADRVAGVDPMLGMRVRLHRLGKPASGDPIVLAGAQSSAFNLAPEVFPIVAVVPNSPWVLAFGSGARSEIRLAVAKLADLDLSGRAETRWQPVAQFDDGVEGAVLHGGRIYLLSHKDASGRRVLSVPVENPDLAQARVEIPEDPASPLMYITDARDALYAERMVAGHAALLRLPWGASSTTSLALPYDGWVDELATDPRRDGLVFDLQGWIQPAVFHAYDPTTGRLKSVLEAKAVGDYSGTIAEEVEAKSADGTMVPLSILRRKDLVLDGSHPAILTGYGGYGVSQTPGYSPSVLAWLERGGVYAIAHVRGGGEKGYAWKANGTGEHKMNGINDFIACAEYLVSKGYTSPAHLAAQGTSMGGVLVGRALTVRPDLFAAANIAVGVLNPVRILAAENGANQKAEMGDPETQAGFKALYEMDPYQHVQPGTAYPAVLFTIGLNDRRVAPWMTAKMAARLQAASTSGKPILVRLDADAGHGIGSTRDQIYAERADIWSFILQTSGDPDFQPAAP